MLALRGIVYYINSIVKMGLYWQKKRGECHKSVYCAHTDYYCFKYSHKVDSSEPNYFMDDLFDSSS